ncbi:hypothetical protein R0381_002594 [Jeongeupia wiesaeckerbachi]|uniref:hypothetical protein n=1 Tax=Jeongeupia wiesaeckerbachi TaxID=3051218 RepID=UPI003D806A19
MNHRQACKPNTGIAPQLKLHVAAPHNHPARPGAVTSRRQACRVEEMQGQQPSGDKACSDQCANTAQPGWGASTSDKRQSALRGFLWTYKLHKKTPPNCFERGYWVVQIKIPAEAGIDLPAIKLSDGEQAKGLHQQT